MWCETTRASSKCTWGADALRPRAQPVLRRQPHAARHRSRRAPGDLHGAARAQRRGQDHALALPDGRAAGAIGLGAAGGRRRHPPPVLAAGAPRHRLRAAGTGDLFPADRGREPRRRRGGGEGRAGAEGGAGGALPHPAHHAAAARRRSFWWPAAAAGHRPGAGLPPAHAVARRAHRGHPALHHQGDRPRLAHPARAGRHAGAGRAVSRVRAGAGRALRHPLARRDRDARAHRRPRSGAGQAAPGAVIRGTTSAVTARGHLAFERAGAATAVRTAYAESPLRFLTPRNHGSAAWAYTSTLGGGLVDGDAIELRVEVGKGARALVTTQGPTRVFRSSGCSGLRPPPVAGGTPARPAGCRCETTARVEEDGALLLVPAPAACFGGARFEQRTEVDLAAGASVLLWDVLSAGRDRWDFVRCSSAITIRREGKPLLDEAWLLDAAHGSLRERFGRFGAIGTLLLAGPLFDGAALREAVDAQAPRAGAPLLQSASPLGADATVVRLAADRVELLLAALRAHLSPLRAFFGDDPWRLDAPHAA